MSVFRAVVRRKTGIAIETVPPRALRPGEVRVAVLGAALCRTDLAVADGRLKAPEGRILGHELAGEVLEAPGRELRVGARVTANPLIPCGTCSWCSKDPERCLQPKWLGLDLDGVFAEEVILPANAVLPVPPGLDVRRTAFVEPVAASMAVMKAGIHPDMRGLVHGKGRIAELTRRVLEAYGFTGVVKSAGLEFSPGAFDFVVETAPSARALGALLGAVVPRGIIVLKSRAPEPVPFDLALAVQKEITLRAVRYGNFSDAMELMLSGRLAVEDLFGPSFRLEEAESAFARAAASEDLKVFLQPS